MAKRKTTYTINFTADQMLVNNTVLSWLNVNGFQLVEKDNYKYYRAGNNMISAYRCFEYYIQGNQLTILAYLKNPKNPFPLDNGMVGVVQTAPYVSLIEELTNAIAGLGMQAQIQYQQGYQQPQPQMQYQQNQYQQPQIYNNVQTYDKNGNLVQTSFAAQNAERQGRCATWAFWMGLASVLIGFMGMAFGWFVIIVTYYLGVIGLKSPKKNTAIAAIALTTIGTIIAVLVMAGMIQPLV